MSTITYISAGYLGDFIHNLSVVNEVFLKTGSKGVVYLYGDFRRGIESTYNDIKELITAQPYIERFGIHAGEPYDIDLTDWYEPSDLLFQKSMKERYAKYGVDWGKHPWIHVKPDLKYSNVTFLSTYPSGRWNWVIDYRELMGKFENPMFLATTQDEYNGFVNDTKFQLPCVLSTSFTELAGIIAGCNRFIGTLSMPEALASSLHKDKITILYSPNNENAVALKSDPRCILYLKDVEPLIKPKLTVISGIYNEEYLLPFWLEHHRKIFDHGVIVDWHSTDRSLEIIREMCPTWEIRTTTNKTFGADEIDQEFMSIEREFSGYKMVLNTTEFLISTKPVRDLIVNAPNSNYSIQGLGAISSDVNTYPSTLKEMMSRVERVNITRRMYRSLFSYPDGKYGLGRHYPVHPITAEIPAYVMWFGFYPWNERAIARKLQISDRIPPHDRARGYSYHHQWNRDEQERQKEIWTSESLPCSEIKDLNSCLNRF